MSQYVFSRAGRALLQVSVVLSLLAGSVQVHAANRVTISGTPPASVTAGTAYSFTPTYTAPAGSTPTFSIANKPSWATFSRHTGRLAGTPSQPGVSRAVRISISDRRAQAWLPPFSIRVKAPTSPTPPLGISGTPPTSVNEGSAYSFTPTATDSAGSTLTFSVSNKPAWAAFNTRSGTLAGTPTAANVGTYSGVLISVTDGKSSVSLSAFTIAVNQVSNGTAEVTWLPPTLNTDGTSLTNLAGYHLRYGAQANNLSQTITIANPGVAAYTVTNLSSGTWYFGVTAYNSAGEESALSNVGNKTLQ